MGSGLDFGQIDAEKNNKNVQCQALTPNGEGLYEKQAICYDGYDGLHLFIFLWWDHSFWNLLGRGFLRPRFN